MFTYSLPIYHSIMILFSATMRNYIIIFLRILLLTAITIILRHFLAINILTHRAWPYILILFILYFIIIIINIITNINIIIIVIINIITIIIIIIIYIQIFYPFLNTSKMHNLIALNTIPCLMIVIYFATTYNTF
jgi:hypothetical protein